MVRLTAKDRRQLKQVTVGPGFEFEVKYLAVKRVENKFAVKLD